jgi:hypothetical protein
MKRDIKHLAECGVCESNIDGFKINRKKLNVY